MWEKTQLLHVVLCPCIDTKDRPQIINALQSIWIITRGEYEILLLGPADHNDFHLIVFLAQYSASFPCLTVSTLS